MRDRDRRVRSADGRERMWARMTVRAADDDGAGPIRFEGVASTFGQPYQLAPGVWEQFEPSAFNNTLQRSDIYLLWQHDSALPLARSGAGNLRLAVEDDGLDVVADLVRTQLAVDAAALMRAGVVHKMSIGFTPDPAGETSETMEDGSVLWRVHNVRRLWEVSLVTWPANPHTDAGVRSDGDVWRELCDELGLDYSAVVSAGDRANLSSVLADWRGRSGAVPTSGVLGSSGAEPTSEPATDDVDVRRRDIEMADRLLARWAHAGR